MSNITDKTYTIINKAVLDNIDYIALLDPKTAFIALQEGAWISKTQKTSDENRSISYSDYINVISEYINNKADKEKFKTSFDFDNIIDKLNKDAEVIFSYYIKNPEVNNICKKQVKFTWLDDAKSQVLVCCIDITKSIDDDHKESLELKNRIDDIDQSIRNKNEYISRMSHDIRTPMNAIVGFAALIKENTDNPQKVHDQADKILKASNYMIGVINDVLDMSKVESGSVHLNNVPFDIEECINNVNEIMKPLMEAKNQTYIFNMDDLKYKNFCADENYLQQILLNIISNSYKYTDEGGVIEVIVKDSLSQGKQYDNVTFVIKDNGRGMSEEFQQTLFTPFKREYRSGIQDPGGTGLGLSLIKNLVEIMGGNIKFKSKIMEGTTFTFTIPLMLDKELSCEFPQTDCQENLNVKDVFKGLSILAAEDNVLNSEILTEVLESRGARIVIEPDGRRVVDRFLEDPENTYDMILMDVMMPELDGYQATKLIRNSERKDGATIPIIAMTANAFDEDAQKSLDAGMNAHVSKPINIGAFERIVARVLK
ncbi:MAG: response regulator [Butyrivibrio sp.]|uniref:ATP-binding response regulator n=1 Tax=Butyrivibrio sp. TaxID=28121 RepID=UPI0025FF25A9|nr:ATP-binding protein [Butyrivibrio sp.]MCR5771251.1 response regulator [Butyrivibrio sp.]